MPISVETPLPEAYLPQSTIDAIESGEKLHDREDFLEKFSTRLPPHRAQVPSTSDCAICLSPLVSTDGPDTPDPLARAGEAVGDDDFVFRNTKCVHMFHDGCIRRWTEEHNTCPACRMEWYHGEAEQIREIRQSLERFESDTYYQISEAAAEDQMEIDIVHLFDSMLIAAYSTLRCEKLRYPVVEADTGRRVVECMLRAAVMIDGRVASVRAHFECLGMATLAILKKEYDIEGKWREKDLQMFARRVIWKALEHYAVEVDCFVGLETISSGSESEIA